MNQEQHTGEMVKPSTLILTASLTIFLTSILYLSYHLAKTNNGRIAIPAGKTYLGPANEAPDWMKPTSPTPNSANETPKTLFTTDTKTPWKTWNDTSFPFTFKYPQDLPLTAFPHDANHAVGISWNGRKAEENILINTIDLTTDSKFTDYIKKQKKAFVDSWWKQYSALTGHTPIEEFTNSHGLKGYRTKFINTKGESPNTDVFFEVPGSNTLLIRVANGPLDNAIFTAIVDSVSWKAN